MKTMHKYRKQQIIRFETGCSHWLDAIALHWMGQRHGTRQGLKWNGRTHKNVILEKSFSNYCQNIEFET